MHYWCFHTSLINLFKYLWLELMYLCLNMLVSKVWKKNCPNFVYTMYKAGRKLKSFSHPSLAIFPLLVMQQIFLILKQVCFFLKQCLHVAVFFNWVPYIQISGMIPGMNKINGKVSVASIYRTGGLGCSETPARVLGGRAPSENF